MFFRQSATGRKSIEFDEVFLDGENLPDFDTHQFEGRIEKPIGKWAAVGLFGVFLLVTFVFSWKIADLQIARGASYAAQSERNRLDRMPIFAERGVIMDRKEIPLAWNTPGVDGFAERSYIDTPGVSHVLGYVSYPAKDAKGIFYKNDFTGKGGIEEAYQSLLSGVNGERIIETDVHSAIISESVVHPPVSGTDITLSIDAAVSARLYAAMRDVATERGFSGGAGVIMDVRTGEIIALSSFPEYDPEVLSRGDDATVIKEYRGDRRNPFLNRAISGLYTPGSIVKPFVALAALSFGVISPETSILSTGSISIPNPYDASRASVFNDWKAHGWVNMRRALAVSSNVYFYEVGGGYGDQTGIGISRLAQFFDSFGIGKKTGILIGGEEEGVVPTPAWKEKKFPGDQWRVGDTYYTSIGQYGFQVTPIQMARAVAAIANGGTLFAPTIIQGEEPRAESIPGILPEHFSVVKAGMRDAVMGGSAQGLSLPFVTIAAKTGTAEVGISKAHLNSWVEGFFPYENPRYAFAVVMEKGPRDNFIGGVFIMRQLLEWMSIYAPEYVSIEE